MVEPARKQARYLNVMIVHVVPLLVSQRLLNRELGLASISSIAYRLHARSPTFSFALKPNKKPPYRRISMFHR
jgi:hypothetical protein